MNIELDDKYVDQLEHLAEARGKSIAEILLEVVETGLASTSNGVPEQDVSVWKPKLMRLLAEMRAMPLEGPDDGFSGADHDELLYPRQP